MMNMIVRAWSMKITSVNVLNDLLEKAILIATQCHTGQVDRRGKPYILHPLRVMLKQRSKENMIIAVLHDVVEDTYCSHEHLVSNGFPSRICHAIKAMIMIYRL